MEILIRHLYFGTKVIENVFLVRWILIISNICQGSALSKTKVELGANSTADYP